MGTAVSAITAQPRTAHSRWTGDRAPGPRSQFAPRRRPEHPSNFGQILVLAVGVVVCSTAPLLGLTDVEWLILGAVLVAMALVLGVSFFVPWPSIRREWTLAFPLAIFAAVPALSFGGHRLGATYGGVLVLCFAYTGLTQSARVNLWLVPSAAAAYLAANDNWSAAMGIRLTIVVFVWVLLSQLLRALTVRNETLTEALRASAHTDPLTGLANRRDLDLHLGRARTGDTLILCDLDHFKAFNDEHGHLAGDRLLREFGLLLRAMLREGDFAARYGGEEFALLLPQTSIEQARIVLARLRDKWELLRPRVTFSAGISLWSTEADLTLEAADRALYAAKAGGRNRDHTA
jgi:diguanylate cyclase (GGDEF)-like protein